MTSSSWAIESALVLAKTIRDLRGTGFMGPQGWLPYADTGPTLRTLHDAGIRVAVVSNIGFDIRPHFAAWGLAELMPEEKNRISHRAVALGEFKEELRKYYAAHQ